MLKFNNVVKNSINKTEAKEAKELGFENKIKYTTKREH